MQLIILAEAFKTECLLIYILGRNSVRLHYCNVNWLLLWLYHHLPILTFKHSFTEFFKFSTLNNYVFWSKAVVKRLWRAWFTLQQSWNHFDSTLKHPIAVSPTRLATQKSVEFYAPELINQCAYPHLCVLFLACSSCVGMKWVHHFCIGILEFHFSSSITAATTLLIYCPNNRNKIKQTQQKLLHCPG